MTFLAAVFFPVLEVVSRWQQKYSVLSEKQNKTRYSRPACRCFNLALGAAASALAYFVDVSCFWMCAFSGTTTTTTTTYRSIRLRHWELEVLWFHAGFVYFTLKRESARLIGVLAVKLEEVFKLKHMCKRLMKTAAIFFIQNLQNLFSPRKHSFNRSSLFVRCSVSINSIFWTISTFLSSRAATAAAAASVLFC